MAPPRHGLRLSSRSATDGARRPPKSDHISLTFLEDTKDVGRGLEVQGVCLDLALLRAAHLPEYVNRAERLCRSGSTPLVVGADHRCSCAASGGCGEFSRDWVVVESDWDVVERLCGEMVGDGATGRVRCDAR